MTTITLQLPTLKHYFFSFFQFVCVFDNLFVIFHKRNVRFLVIKFICCSFRKRFSFSVSFSYNWYMIWNQKEFYDRTHFCFSRVFISGISLHFLCVALLKQILLHLCIVNLSKSNVFQSKWFFNVQALRWRSLFLFAFSHY